MRHIKCARACARAPFFFFDFFKIKHKNKHKHTNEIFCFKTHSRDDLGVAAGVASDVADDSDGGGGARDCRFRGRRGRGRGRGRGGRGIADLVGGGRRGGDGLQI